MLMRHLFRPDHDTPPSGKAHHPLDNGVFESHRMHMENAVMRVSVVNYASASTNCDVDVDTCHLQFSLLAESTPGRFQIVVMTVKHRPGPPRQY